MKNYFLYLILFIIIFGRLSAEENLEPKPASKKFAVKVEAKNIIGLALDIRNELALNPHIDLIFPGYFQYFPEISLTILQKRNTKISVARAHVGMGLRWNIGGRPMEHSYYLEGAVVGGYTNFRGEHYGAINPMLVFGHTWIFAKGFNFSLAGGPQWEFILNEKGPKLVLFRQKTLAPTLVFPVKFDILFGWAF